MDKQKKWEKVRLGDVCEISSGGTPSRAKLEYYNGTILWAKISDIESSNGTIYETEEKITLEGLKNIRNKIFNKGTLLFSMYGSIGKTAFAGKELSCNQAILGIEPKEESIISLEYLNYWLKQEKKNLIKLGNGATLKNLSATIIRNLQIPLPPLSIQKEIADKLDKISEIIEKRKLQIEKMDELLQGTFIEMFGDPVSNPKGWGIKKLGEISKLKAGKNIKASQLQIKSDIYYFPCFGGNGIRGYLDFYSHEGNYPLIGRQGALCGNVQYGTGKFYVTEHAIVVDSQETVAKWLYFLLNLLDLNKLKTGAAQPGLNIEILSKVEIPEVPITLQNQFAKIVEKVEVEKEKLEKSLLEMEALFNSLMDESFN